MTTAVREFTANIRREEGAYWTEVAELPGCFASGFSLDELLEALIESIQMYLTDAENSDEPPPSVQLGALRMVVDANQ